MGKLKINFFKSKKAKIFIIALLIIAMLALLLAILQANYHKIYVELEKSGVFCNEIAVSKHSDQNFREYRLEELENDGRVVFDQSMMLINKDNFLPEGFRADIEEYKDTDVYMNKCMIEAYMKLSADVKKSTGNKLYVSSDFRTQDEQEALYSDDPATATLPGASEHQSGLALDVYVAYYAGDSFVRSPSGRFVNSNSWKYGFIIRYPSYGEEKTKIRFEPWHIRYVGAPHAAIIYNNHITLEEYILSMEEDAWYESSDIDLPNTKYLVSRQKISDDGSLTMPAAFDECIISPDNTGYYIITLKIVNK